MYFWLVRHSYGPDSRQSLKAVKCPKSDRKNSLIKTIPEANPIFKSLSETYWCGLQMRLS